MIYLIYHLFKIRIAFNDRNAFFTLEKPKKYQAWSCQNVCEALTFLLNNIFNRFGTKLFRQVVGIPMGTNCAPLVANFCLFCFERDFMMSLSDLKQADVIDALNTFFPSSLNFSLVSPLSMKLLYQQEECG